MTDNHDRAIGRIEGKLDRLLIDMEHANQKRAEQYQRLDKIERKLDVAEENAHQFHIRLEKVEKPVADFNKWRERAIGAVMLISLSAALIGGTVAAYWHKIIAVTKGL